MEILVAKSSGFCFGVKRAIKIADKCAGTNPEGDTYTLGPIIHNPQVVKRLEESNVFARKSELHFEDYLPSEEVAAMCLEPVQGEGGYIVPPKEFIQIMHSTCKRHGILFVDDEVQAGMARTGRMWALEHHGVVPDIMCSANALRSAAPIHATVFRIRQYRLEKVGRAKRV